METRDPVRARRNVRSYPTDAVPEAAWAQIVEAGWRASSASNRQHCDSVIVTDREQPAAIALVVPSPPDGHTRVIDQYDLGQASYAIMLAAADRGIGTGHSSGTASVPR